LHEFLGARGRPGPYGGDFAGRTRLLRTIIERVREEWPTLMIGVRLSFFDMIPFEAAAGPGPKRFPCNVAVPIRLWRQ
jgi:2,4-dienoyl-CoA reductase-like NADH-dependent reductase (Old Yellow Enzyme family)